MQFKNVTAEQLKDMAEFIGVKTIPAYAAKGWVGACLRPTGDRYRRTSASPWSHRKVHAVCWCGHRRFLIELFNRYPDAKVRTSGPGGPALITAELLPDWLIESADTNVGSHFYPAYPRDLCLDHEPASTYA
jgi:hypothetical protein